MASHLMAFSGTPGPAQGACRGGSDLDSDTLALRAIEAIAAPAA